MTSYDLVATLGPATASETLRLSLIGAGATGFRFNTSHTETDHLLEDLDRLERLFRNRESASVASRPFIVLDLQGSKWRLGDLPEATLREGERVRLVYRRTAEGSRILPVPHQDFFTAAEACPGEIRLNDARVQLEIESISETEVVAIVRQGGEISARKGVSLPCSSFRREEPTEKDSRLITATRGMEGIRYAFSYVRDGAEMKNYRRLAGDAYVIAKIERAPAVDDIAAIAEHADEIWLCRGDLGAELGLAGMARAAYDFAAHVSRLSVPCLLAGQVLEHMTRSPDPTRSEVCMMHDALRDGYSGFVLSDETAVGRFPVESCRVAAMFMGAD